ncbi:SDR family oxidoreductase [Sphingomonas kyeonggiensis]|uniref:NAD(P)-dependent dehydrogenase (Short-subunit alcohol dehydrogenase family) n=1 Tax=Sphingomonas kyeonggiensis TaxID=1268553 RepID=A0A7W6JRC5_9SPHN|nr:SDR family oxidoreductase [Sphingomonas kyeonggiensis]MBB4097082.1 NAD(P)-dependent dehydrogenase (short-subunit alcohol dehydrogenase family) [Sphingomonas kyeonggiensis]
MRILVTGGARRIGAGIARRLALRGHQVAIHHHHAPEDAEALAAQIAAEGGTACVVTGELAEAETAPALLHAAREGLGGPIDGLVNNASQFAWDALPLTDFALLDRHMRVNCGAPIALASALAAQDDLDQGAVVNLLDQKLANLNPDFLTYTLSKAALATATELLARGLAPRIRVNAVSPGLTLPSLDQTAEEFAEHARQNLLQRPVALGDIAATVEMLLVTPSITGQNIFVDCGQRFLQRDGDVMFEGRERPHG